MPTSSEPFTPQDWQRMAAVGVLFLFASFFWGAYEQAGSTLNLFADRYVHLELLGVRLYASWFVSIQAAFVIVLSPVFAWLWVRLGPRQPSSPPKFELALLFVGLAFVLLIRAGAIAQGGVKISPVWLVGAYFLEELGELCLSPVGLSVVTKLAPRRVVGLLMGVFFLSNALGNKLAGWSAGFISTTPLPTLFGVTAGVTLGAAAVLFVLIKPVQRVRGGVRWRPSRRGKTPPAASYAAIQCACVRKSWISSGKISCSTSTPWPRSAAASCTVWLNCTLR